MAIESEVELLKQLVKSQCETIKLLDGNVGKLTSEVKQLTTMVKAKAATVRKPTNVNGFVLARCEEDADACVSKDALYREYREWCRENGKGKPKELLVFYRDLYRAMPILKSVRLNTDGVRTHAVTGVRLAQPA